MEELFQALGITALVVLALVGAVLGWIASLLTGGNRAVYIIAGLLAAVAAPFIAAALGLAALAASGILALVVIGLIGAAIVLALVRMATRRRD